ncbi:MAG: primosomal protein N' (replication factor Y), partial [Glaciecola sp.]
MSLSHSKTSKQATLAYVQVALPVPLHRMFAYSFDAKDIQIFQKGCRVVVPFGKKNLVGIITGTAHTTDYEVAKIKSVVELIDNEPIFSPSMITLAKWIADFYIYPLGEVYAGMLPVLLRKVSSETLKTTSVELPLLALLHA